MHYITADKVSRANTHGMSLHAALKAQGFIIYAGQGDLGRQIFRIAHMGDIQEEDLIRLCTALTGNLGARP